MMYQILYSTNSAEVGPTFPQSQKGEHLISVEDQRHLWKQPIGKFRSDVVIPKSILHSSAKLTDYISSSVISLRLIVSDKLKQILEANITIGDCEFFPTVIIQKKKEYDYWIVNPIVFRIQLVDFPRSELWVTNGVGSRIRGIQITDYNDYLESSKQLHISEGITLYNVSFLDNMKENLVVLRFVEGGIGFYVSDKVKTEIEEAGCTGLIFK